MKLLLYLGNFGYYQAFLYALIAIPGITGGAQTIAFAWTAYAGFSRCFVPGFDTENTTYGSILPEKEKWFVEPKTNGQYCQYCPYSTDDSSCTIDRARNCDNGIIYDEETALIPNSLNIKLELSCQNIWKRQLIWSLYTIGMLIGAGLSGILADRFGRRKVLLCGSWIVLVLVNIAPFAENYYAYAILQILIGAIHYGCFLTAFIVFMELTSGLPRTIFGILYQGYFTLGMLWVGLAAYLFRDWRWVQFAAGAPAFGYVVFYWLFPESIRWLLVNGREEEAWKQIKKVAKINGVIVPREVFEEETRLNHVFHKNEVRSTAMDLFRHDWALARSTLIVFFTWLAVCMCYFGLLQNTNDLPGDPFTTFTLSVAAEIPGEILCIPMMEKMGRKNTLVVLMGFGGAACIAAGFLQHAGLVLSLALIGKLCISGAFCVAYNYSAEMFPTVVRQSGTGLSSVCARIGSLTAPQIRLLGDYIAPWVPITIYGSFALCSAFLDILLPETKDKELPETIIDGVEFCRGKAKLSVRSSQVRIKSVCGIKDEDQIRLSALS